MQPAEPSIPAHSWIQKLWGSKRNYVHVTCACAFECYIWIYINISNIIFRFKKKMSSPQNSGPPVNIVGDPWFRLRVIVRVSVRVRVRAGVGVRHAGWLKWYMPPILCVSGHQRWVTRRKTWSLTLSSARCNTRSRRRIKAPERWRRRCLKSSKWTRSQLSCVCVNGPMTLLGLSHRLLVINYSISVFNLPRSC